MKLLGMNFGVVLCTLAGVLLSGSAARADVIVTGTGKVVVVPDIAFITLAVVTDGDTASSALDANNVAMRRLFKLLADLGIDERDVQTSHFSISPKYRHPAGSEPILIGYTVSNQITVTVRQLDEMGTVLDSLVKEGANRVSSVTFAVSDPEKAMDEARAKAMADAKRKADIYAKGGNVTLGPVVRITETDNAPAMRWQYEAAALKPGVPLAHGEKELTVTVTVVYAIGGAQK
jgi:uncharacterized protein YggE